MSLVTHARKRIDAILNEIGRLKESEFPYPSSRDALNLLNDAFSVQKCVLEKINANTTPKSIQTACSASLNKLFDHVPILGFILRSTNVRNGFEVYSPLLRLAKLLLGPDTKLIVSSEWDLSPFVYRSITELPGFVLIGLPAHESSNALLLSLTGHELGHSVWAVERFSRQFEKRIESQIKHEITGKYWNEYVSFYPNTQKEDVLSGDDLLTPSTWENAYIWALLQTEEIFCDILGLRLFAESYLHAFNYLLSPSISGPRPLHYPNISRRVICLMKAATEFNITYSPDLNAEFIDGEEPSDSTTAMLVSIADDVSDALVPDLIQLTKEFAENKAIPSRNPARVHHIKNEYQKWITPTAKKETLTDILNAGWECDQDQKLWDNVSQIKPEDRGRVLRDLLLKSMEISEIYERLGPHYASQSE